MKVVYGTSLPPNLTAPTRGELVVRIDSFVLQEAQLSYSHIAQHPAVAALHDTSDGAASEGDLKTTLEKRCCIAPQFWGESRPSVYALPPTPSAPNEADGSPRTHITAKFPVKTLPAQLEQYFRHMTLSSMGGLPVYLVIPGAKLGKKRDAVLGVATVAMTDLSPTTPIAGWFTLVAQPHNDGAAEIAAEDADKDLPIGRVKLSISLSFFNTAKADNKGKSAASPPRRDTVATSNPGDGGASQSDPILSTGGLNTSHYPLVKNAPLSADAEGRVRVEINQGPSTSPPPATAKPILLPPSYHSRGGPTSSDQSPTAQFAPHRSQVLPSEQRAAAAQQNHRFQDQFNKLLQRGERLRDSIAHASNRTGEHAIEHSLAARSRHMRTVDSERRSSPYPFGANITGLEHRFDHGRSGVVLPAESRYGLDQDDVSDESANGDATYDSEFPDGYFPVSEGVVLSAPHTQGGMYLPHRRGSVEGELPTNTISPSRVFDRDRCLVEIMMQSFSFSEPVDEIRVQVRTSPDVLCENPFDALSSFVHYLGKEGGHGIRIPLSFEVTSFTSESKCVIECFAVKSKPIVLTSKFGASASKSNPNDRVLLSEGLLGVVFLGLYSTANRVVKFHDPLTGKNPVECCVDVRVHQIRSRDSTAEEEVDVGENRLIPPSLRQSQQRKRVGVDSASQMVSDKEQTTEWNPAGYHFAADSYADRKANTGGDALSPGDAVKKPKKRHGKKVKRQYTHRRKQRGNSSSSNTSTTSFTSTTVSSSRSSSAPSARSSDTTSSADGDHEIINTNAVATDDGDGDDDAAQRFRDENRRRFEMMRDGAGSPLSSLHSPTQSYASGKPPLPLPLSPTVLGQRIQQSPPVRHNPPPPLQQPRSQHPPAGTSGGAITIPVKVSRLHVAIKAAKSLPNVRCGGRLGAADSGGFGRGQVLGADLSFMQFSESSGPTSPNTPVGTTVASNISNVPDYAAPNSFCVVEDLIYEDSPASGATFPAATMARGGAPTASTVMEGSGEGGGGPCTVFREFLARIEERERLAVEAFKSAHGPSATPPSHWAVEAATRGHYDRTSVVANNNRPVFNYECSLGVTLPSAQQQRKPPPALNTRYDPNAARDAFLEDPLRHMQGLLISVWHSQPSAAGMAGYTSPGAQQGGSPKIANAGNPNSSTAGSNTERAFWERACRLGTCFVDLRPMKYYPTVDGWYRVYSDSNSVDTTVGFVHVAVRKIN